MYQKIVGNYREILINTCFAVVIGVLVGIMDTIFGRVLLLITDFRDQNTLILVPFLPIAGLGITLIYKWISKESLKGMTLVFQTGHGERNKIPKLLIPLIMLSTWITHLFGGSAGREGVAVQIGATMAHTIGRKTNQPDNARVLLVAGMAAGFAGLFQTPLAATFFAIEVLVAGTFMYEALLPALAASFVASVTSHTLGLEKFSVLIQEDISFSQVTIPKLIIIGIVFGIVGGFFAHALAFTKQKMAEKIEDPRKRIFFVGCILAILLLVLHMGRYCGLGTNLINLSFTSGQILPYDWIIKILLTIVTLSVGYQGGEVTPLFSIGACLGVVLAGLFGLPVMLVAALGYAAVFGSATNTLFAPILIGAEVFGQEHILLFVIVCSLAYVFNGNNTIYASQKKYSYLDSLKG